jgi:ribose transport system substrate-binding protein
MLSMRYVSFLLLAGSCGMVLTMTGCSSDSGKPRIAFVSNNAHQFWTFAEKGALKAGEDFDVRVEFKKPPNGEVKEQRDYVEDLINRNFKGIAVSPNDPHNNLSFFKDTASKVALVMADNDLPDPSGRRCYIGTDNYMAGREAGELVKKALPQGGKIAVFVGRMDATNAIERRQGVLDVLADKKLKQMGETLAPDKSNFDLGHGFTLIATITDSVKETECEEKAKDLLNKHPDVACLVGLWEYNPPALLRAVQSSKNEKKPAIVAFDENEQTLKGIESDAIVGSVVQNPYQFGYLSVKVLAGLVQGKGDVSTLLPGIDKENRFFVPYRVITKTNVAEFHAEVNKLLGK